MIQARSQRGEIGGFVLILLHPKILKFSRGFEKKPENTTPPP